MTKDEADNNLRQAIIEHAEAYDINAKDSILNHYGVICHWQRFEANGRSSYTTHFHTNDVPNHIAVGLFQTGVDLVKAQDDGDD